MCFIGCALLDVLYWMCKIDSFDEVFHDLVELRTETLSRQIITMDNTTIISGLSSFKSFSTPLRRPIIVGAPSEAVETMQCLKQERYF